MREKAMREVILAQLGALRADAGVELVAGKDTCVGDYLTGKADALAVAMQMVEAKALIESMANFLRHEETRNMNMAESAHQMMDAREQEEARTAALASQVATKKYDPSAARQRFWKEVAIYPLTLVCAAVYTLLMAVAQ